VKAHPWAKYDDVDALRRISVSFLFLLLAWNVRHKFTSPSTAMYFGSLFATYSRNCYWWEIVNVMRKEAAALFL